MPDETDFYRRVGRTIAELRRDSMTQKQLANHVSLSRTSIANIEKGRQQLLLHHAVQIADALGVVVNALVPPPSTEQAGQLQQRLDELPDAHKRWVESSVQESFRRRTR